MTKRPDPRPVPEGLSERSAKLWQAVVGPGTPIGRAALIESALRSLDRADQARSELERAGLSVTTEGGMVHLHPLLKIERDSRALFLSAWRSLRLQF